MLPCHMSTIKLDGIQLNGTFSSSSNFFSVFSSKLMRQGKFLDKKRFVQIDRNKTSPYLNNETNGEWHKDEKKTEHDSFDWTYAELAVSFCFPQF